MTSSAKLIARQRLDGVPFRAVKDASISVSIPGKVKREDYGLGSTFPIVDQSVEFVAGYTDDSSILVPADEYIIFGDHTRAVKFVDFAFAQGADGIKVLKAAPGVLTRWLYYCLGNLDIPSRGYNRHWSVAKEMRIPVPPVETQAEIVARLDRFTMLKSELEAELSARRRQRVAHAEYLPLASHVRQMSPEGYERVPLRDVATQYVEPLRVVPSESYVNLGVKWYGEGVFSREPKLGKEIKGNTLYRVRSGQFIYNRMFVTEGAFGLVTSDLANGVVSNEFPVYDLDQSRILPEWLLLIFQDPGTVRAAAAQATGGTKSRRRWKENQFEAFTINLPSLAAQREIVRMFGIFRDLEAAIEAELAAREVQYHHYRDQLMTFGESA